MVTIARSYTVLIPQPRPHAFGELEIDGTIDGCGAGTFRVSYVAEFSEADAVTGYRTGWDIARLIPGSGYISRTGTHTLARRPRVDVVR